MSAVCTRGEVEGAGREGRPHLSIAVNDGVEDLCAEGEGFHVGVGGDGAHAGDAADGLAQADRGAAAVDVHERVVLRLQANLCSLSCISRRTCGQLELTGVGACITSAGNPLDPAGGVR